MNDNTVGVYRIINKVNGCFYGGSSVNVSERWAAHLRQAKAGSPYPIHRAIRKYGNDNFSFELIISCKKEDLARYEQSWLDENINNPKCYNVANNVYSPMRGRKHTQKTILKISKNRKLATTEETRKKVGLSWKNKKQPREMVEKRTQKIRGRKYSDSHKQSLREAALKRYDSEGKPYPALAHENGKIINSGTNVRRMCKENSLDVSGVFRLINGVVNTYKGWGVVK